MVLASDNKFPKVILEERLSDGSDTLNPAADHRSLFLGEDGLLRLRDSAGGITEIGSGAIDWGETADITTLDWDDAPDDGALDEAARADHRHGMPSEPVGGGGGGVTQSYIGYNAVGASWETASVNEWAIAKQIVLSDPALITDVQVYTQIGSANTISAASAALYSDSAGAPGRPLRTMPERGGAIVSMPATTPIWLGTNGLGYVPAGTYWIVIRIVDAGGGALAQVAYDGSGSDQTQDFASAAWPIWGGSAGTRKYSIRASVITDLPTATSVIGKVLPLDVPPASANAADDNFTGDSGESSVGSLAGKWTNPLSSLSGLGLDLQVYDGYLFMRPLSSSARLVGIRQNSPAGSFSVSAKVRMDYPYALNTDTAFGIFVARTTGTKMHHAGLWHQNGGQDIRVLGSAGYSETADGGGYDGFVIDVANQFRQDWRWYKIDWNAGTGVMEFFYSADGVRWRSVGTRASQSQPDRIGIAYYSNSATIQNTMHGAVEWFRVV
jgi:hypothetical protein